MHNKVLSAALGILILLAPTLPASSNENPSDGGPGVYPHDILYSKSTHVYKTF